MSIVWAAGFFDGEGSTSLSRTGRNSGPRLYYGLRVSAGQTSKDEDAPEVLIKLRDTLGVGRVFGPYVRDGKRRKYYWVVTGPSAGLALAQMWPHLGSVKREQASLVINRLSKNQREKLPKRLVSPP